MDRSVTTIINQDKCNGCGLCIKVCPCRTISLEDGKAIISGNESIGCGHCEAICPTGAIKVMANKNVFSFHSATETETVIQPGDYDLASLINLMRSRRSCRNYKEKPVAKALLKDLINIGITAPSGTNSQGWTFTIVPDRQQMITLGNKIAGYFAKLNKMAENPILRLLDKSFSQGKLAKYHKSHYHSVKYALDLWKNQEKDSLFHGATAAIIVGSTPEASCPHDDALLASQNILLGAHSMGLGSCLIGFAVHAINNDNNIKRQLVDEHETIYSVIALGHPAEKYPRHSGRKKPRIRTSHLS